MGTKISTVVINTNLVSIEKVISSAYAIYKDTINDIVKDEHKKEDKLPTINSIYLEVTKPWNNGMAFLYSGSFDECGIFLIAPDKMVGELSKKIKDIPFIFLNYHSVSSTGNCMVYVNGECIKETKAKEGDYNKNIDPVFKKYFGMRKRCFKEIDDVYIHNTYYHGQFILGSFSHLEYILKNNNKKDSTYYKHHELEYLAVESLIHNPELTENEWKSIRGNIDAVLPISYYKDGIYNDYINRHWASRVFNLTEGNTFSGAYLLDEPREIYSEEYFALRKKCMQDYEEWKDTQYGKRPESYILTKEELNTLSYEDQKKEAYRRLEIARKRGDQAWSSNFYTQGIKFPLDVKYGDYLKLNDGRFARICFTRLTEDNKNKCFVEEIKVSLPKGDKNFHENIFITDMSSFTKVLESEVPEECRIPDNIIRF